MKPYLFSVLSLMLGSNLYAQDVKGKVSHLEGDAVIAANVTLLNAQDSSANKYSITDENGSYAFEDVVGGNYIVKVDDMSSGIIYSNVFEHDANSNTELTLLQYQHTTNKLDELVVQYQRPIIEVKADRIVFNVDSTINAVGQNALELLRKSPGVQVDKDENVNLSGKSGVAVYIDGRPSPLKESDLAEYLKSIQSDAIDAIEIISNPSAKYDAAGNAGIINIRFKKNKVVGTNGSVNIGYGIEKYGKYNGGFTLNHKSGKWNLFSSYNLGTGAWYSLQNLDRTYLDTFYNNVTHSKTPFTSHNFNVGADYNITDKSLVGITVNGSFRKSENIYDSDLKLQNLEKTQLYNIVNSDNTINSDRNSMNTNLHYNWADKATNKSFSVELDYGYYDMKSNQYQPNIYYNGNMDFLYEQNYKLVTPSQINILSGKADYERNALGGVLGFGVKVSHVNTDNKFDFFNEVDKDFIVDKLKSNQFDYKEDIQAIYVNYSRKLTEAFTLQAGLRGENTVTRGHSLGLKDVGGKTEVFDTTFNRNYANLFPNVSLSFSKNPMNQFSLNYSRRIDRPNYQDLNPFETRVNDYIFRKGNINLQPQMANTFSLVHTYKYMITTKLEYSRFNNVFAELVDTIDTYKAVQYKDNLATQDYFALGLSIPYQYKKFSVFTNVNANYNMYKADFGNNKSIDLSVFSVSGYGQVNYKITDWLSGEVSGWFSTPSVWQGTFKSRGMGGIDVGAQAKVLKGKGNIKVSMGDIFRTMGWYVTSDFAGQQVVAHGRWESQQFRVNFNYNFGNMKLNKRTKTAEEEFKRIGEGDGGGIGGGR